MILNQGPWILFQPFKSGTDLWRGWKGEIYFHVGQVEQEQSRVVSMRHRSTVANSPFYLTANYVLSLSLLLLPNIHHESFLPHALHKQATLNQYEFKQRLSLPVPDNSWASVSPDINLD